MENNKQDKKQTPSFATAGDAASRTFQLVKPENRQFPGLTEKEEGAWNGPFYFILAADTQLGLIDSWNGVPENEITWDKEIVLTNKAIECINQLKPKPKFVSICGDLVDASPETEKHELQIRDLLECLEKLDQDIPLLCLPGNHDIGNSPTAKTIMNYRRDFGDDFYSAIVGGVLFLVLNNQFYKDSGKVLQSFEEHESWMNGQLSTARSKKYKHCILFQHIPWFHDDPDEEEDYFNIEPEKRRELLERFKEAGVRHAFAGHYHRNAGGWDNDFEMNVTSAVGCQLGDDLPGMRIVRVFEDRIDHKYYDFDNFPKYVPLDKNSSLP